MAKVIMVRALEQEDSLADEEKLRNVLRTLRLEILTFNRTDINEDFLRKALKENPTLIEC